jgi:hypothetical protein
MLACLSAKGVLAGLVIGRGRIARLRIALQRLAKLARAIQGVGLAKRVVVKGPALAHRCSEWDPSPLLLRATDCSWRAWGLDRPSR